MNTEEDICGDVDPFIHLIKERKTIDEVIKMCAEPPDTSACEAGVILAKNVILDKIRKRKTFLRTTVKRNPKRINITKIQCSQDLGDGIYGISKTRVPQSKKSEKWPNRELVDLLIDGYDPAVHTLSPEDIIHARTAQPGEYLYCFNVDLSHLANSIPSFIGYLDGSTMIRMSAVDPSRNGNVKNAPGINSSFFYISQAGAFGEVHVEDSNLGSFNLVYMNLPPIPRKVASKFWLVIKDREKLLKVVRTLLCKPGMPEEPLCAHILHHKNVYLTIEFLEDYEIGYATFKQFPGDLVYIKPGVFHQVINLSPNFAEAINFGDAEWCKMNELSETCVCKENRFIVLKPPEGIKLRIKIKGLKRLHRCEEKNCEFSTPLKKRMDLHKRDAHGRPLPKQERRKIVCALCGSSFTRLSAHKKTLKHLAAVTKAVVSSRDGTEKCKYCKKTIFSMDKTAHIRNCDGRNVKCALCERTCNRKCDLMDHIAKCHPGHI
ncbi:hypothetical protein QAD02_005400 [Eretmocerus hayati]|uniref:Uncharacterized protein n=1 Tax=Eretmocerus hayati TaxID=131215 RepID=A0ACC2NSF3_9HYME|nr:hypothetical protein QAD02_005400 [Eretmocerus hayati]